MRNLKRKRRCARKFLGLYFFDYPPDLSIPLSPVAASNCAAECALAVQAIDTGFVVLRDQSRASGPMRIPTAKSENAANHADALIGPPATSNATPVPQALNAHENEPTCAQFSGPTECAGMSNGRVVFRIVDGLVDWKREGTLLH